MRTLSLAPLKRDFYPDSSHQSPVLPGYDRAFLLLP